MEFFKYEGLGNDFIIINEEINSDIIKKICDRRFGIGADGVIINSTKNGKYFMNFYNSDGSIATMCGNGIRCYSQYIREFLTNENNIEIDTRAGIKYIEVIKREKNKQLSSVNMGMCSDIKALEIIVDNTMFSGIFINSGTSHIVIEVENIIEKDVEYYGAIIEKKYKSNVNFIKRIDKKIIEIMTWEKGVGITLACGTGAVAAAYVIGENIVDVKSKGGILTIDLSDRKNIKMIGESTKVYKGIY